MSAERFLPSSQVIVRTKDAVHRLRPGASYRVGRDPASDIVVADARVSWEHAIVRGDENGWVFEDLGSTNGTFSEGRRISRFGIEGDCQFRLGHPENGALLA